MDDDLNGDEAGDASALPRELSLLWVIDAYEHAKVNERSLTRAIRAARLHGATWEEVGASIGVSKQTASKRYGPRIDAVDGLLDGVV